MNLPADISALATSVAAPDAAQLKRKGASKDFEALLIGQMLHSVREEGSGWLGTGDDQSSSAAFGLGEEQLARALTARGGLGLSRVIEEGLRKQERLKTATPDASN
jgi:Rod binding domain-containing protein